MWLITENSEQPTKNKLTSKVRLKWNTQTQCSVYPIAFKSRKSTPSREEGSSLDPGDLSTQRFIMLYCHYRPFLKLFLDRVVGIPEKKNTEKYGNGRNVNFPFLSTIFTSSIHYFSCSEAHIPSPICRFSATHDPALFRDFQKRGKKSRGKKIPFPRKFRGNEGLVNS